MASCRASSPKAARALVERLRTTARMPPEAISKHALHHNGMRSLSWLVWRRPAAEPSQGRDRTPLWCNACLRVASGGILAVVRSRSTGARAAFELEPWQLAIGLAPRERTGQPNRFGSRLTS